MKKFKAGDKVRCVRYDHSHGGYARPGDILEVTEVKSWQHNTFIAGEFCGYNDSWELLPSRPDPLEYLKDHLTKLPASGTFYEAFEMMLADCYGQRPVVTKRTFSETTFQDIT